MSNRFDLDKDAEWSAQDVDEANQILSAFKTECWPHAETIDEAETDHGEGFEWDALISGYALGKGARVQILPLLQLHWYDFLHSEKDMKIVLGGHIRTHLEPVE